MNTFEVMNNPLNRRDWVILKDHRFYLSQPVNIPALDGGTGVGYNQKYPVRKNFRLDLPHYCKTRLSGAGNPVDYDAHYSLYICHCCRSYYKCISSRQLESSNERNNFLYR
jgi:hypothetical protein